MVKRVLPGEGCLAMEGEVTSSERTECSLPQHMSLPDLESNLNKRLHLLLSRKRQEHSSPISSPSQSTRSPHSKRARTFAEAQKHKSRGVSDCQVDFVRRPLASVTSDSQVQIEVNPSES